jgi:hypothetical protein
MDDYVPVAYSFKKTSLFQLNTILHSKDTV